MDNRIPSLLRGEDLLKQVKPEKAPLPAGFWKLITLEVFTVLAGFLAGRFGAEYGTGKTGFYIAASALLIFLALAGLSSVFTISRARQFAVNLLSVLAFLAGFYISFAPPANILVAAFLVALIFGTWGDQALYGELHNRLKVRFISLTGHHIGKTLTGYLLAAAILFVPLWQKSPMPIPEDQFRTFYSSSVKLAELTFPDLKLDASVADFTESLARKQLQNNPEFAKLPPAEQKALASQSAGLIVIEAMKNLKIDITPEMPIADVFYKYLTNLLTGWKANFGDAFTWVFALFVFLFLRGIGFILVWAATLFAILVYELLGALGWVSVVGETVTRERVILT